MSKLVSEIEAKLTKLDPKTDAGRDAAIALIREAREKVSIEAQAKRQEAQQLSRLLLKYEGTVDQAARRRRRGASYEIVPGKKPAAKK